MDQSYPPHIKPNLAEISQNSLILSPKQNLIGIIGTKLIENYEVKRKSTNKTEGKCTPKEYCTVDKVFCAGFNI